MTNKKDILLIYIEDKPISFAQIKSIIPDSKPGWFQIELLMLQIPVHIVTWILRENYINGDKFMMNGQNIYFEKIVYSNDNSQKKNSKKKCADIIQLFDS